VNPERMRLGTATREVRRAFPELERVAVAPLRVRVEPAEATGIVGAQVSAKAVAVTRVSARAETAVVRDLAV